MTTQGLSIVMKLKSGTTQPTPFFPWARKMRGFRQKPAIFLSDEKFKFKYEKFKFKYLITDKHILRFAQIIKTVAKKKLFAWLRFVWVATPVY